MSSVHTEAKTIDSEKEAISIAVKKWQSIYGKKQIQEQKPYFALTVGEVWVVHGSLPPQTAGGVAWAVISKKDGAILGVTHTK